MKYNPEKHHRRSIRLKGYDYSQPGWYFVTVVAQNRDCLFGEIADGEMLLNEIGIIVRDEWIKTAEIRPEIRLDEYIIMPNHIHGIIIIVDDNRRHATGRGDPRGTPTRPVAPTIKPGPKPKSIGSIMAGFKSAVTKRVNAYRGAPGQKLWQRNYWEHIIRNEIELNRIRNYIINNPKNWDEDRFYF